MARQTSLEVYKEADALLKELKAAFGVKTNTGVIRKALQLSRFMAQQADENHTVVIETKDREKTRILLTG